jgi:hypothetical protein
MDREQSTNYMADKAERMIEEMEKMRVGLLGATGRLRKAEEMKADANDYLKRQQTKRALGRYLTAIWLLQGGTEPYPIEVAVCEVGEGRLDDQLSGSAVAAMLGNGAPDAELDGERDVGKVRRALHLNVAAATLKLNDHTAARAACEFVLLGEPTNEKALFRLARAHEGEGSVEKAKGILKGLAASNEEAAELLAQLRARDKKEAQAFKGMFDRGGARAAPAKAPKNKGAADGPGAASEGRGPSIDEAMRHLQLLSPEGREELEAFASSAETSTEASAEALQQQYWKEYGRLKPSPRLASPRLAWPPLLLPTLHFSPSSSRSPGPLLLSRPPPSCPCSHARAPLP